jgi:hypothetical protein
VTLTPYGLVVDDERHAGFDVKGHKPKPHEHGVLTRTPDTCGWSHAAVPAQAAERYAAAIEHLASLQDGETPVLVEQVVFGQVVRQETFRIGRPAVDG